MLPEVTSKASATMPGQFAAALLDPARPAPSGFTRGLGGSAQRRFNVYRNNVTVSLIEALAAIYPAVQRLTGPDFFREMARAHIRSTPPTSPLLYEYGGDFPSFIDHYPYAQDFPWLGDVARIERAWLDACHSADAAPLSSNAIAAISQEELSDLRFIAHPAARIVRSRYSAGSIFTANRSTELVASLQAGTPQDVLITRPDAEVEVRYLPAGGAEFIESLLRGSTLAVAASEAFERCDAFDLAANLSGALQAAVFSDLRLRT